MSLETHFFSSHLERYKNSSNKIDKNLATLLFNAVDAISEFLNDAQIQEGDEKADVNELIPSIKNEICQAHRYYYCKACNQSIRASSKAFNDHFYGNKHLKKLRSIEQSMGTTEKAKKTQKMGSTQSLDSSNTDPPKIKQTKKERLNSLPVGGGPPKQPQYNLPKKVVELLNGRDLDQFTTGLLAEGAQLKNSKIHTRVCEMLQRQLGGRFPNVKAYPFGSTVIGLGREGGDLDIFIDVDRRSYSEKPSKRKMKDAIFQTQRILTSNSREWGDFEPVTNARTPILRVFCRGARIDCDLSFSNGLSSCNTALIGYFIDLQPVCKKLAAFVKQWVSKSQLGVNSYIVSLLVIFYLQQQGLLPTVQVLQEVCKPLCIDNWRANFGAIPLADLKIPIATDFNRHLLGFFRYYGFEFNYAQHVVSVLAGFPVDKSLFDHGNEENLPPIFERFKNYMANIDLDEADEVEDLFSNHKPLVIQVKQILL